MVGHVRTLGTVMLFHGVALLAFALFCAFGAVVLGVAKPGSVSLEELWPWLAAEFLDGGGGEPPKVFLVGLYGVMCLQYTVLGALSVVAGARLRRFRGRWLGAVSLVLGLSTVLGCFCLPLAGGLVLYGLIINLDRDVREAWGMAGEGASYEEIMARYGITVPSPGSVVEVLDQSANQ